MWDFFLLLAHLLDESRSHQSRKCVCEPRRLWACPKARDAQSHLDYALAVDLASPSLPGNCADAAVIGFLPSLCIWPFLVAFHFLHGSPKSFLWLRHIPHPLPPSLCSYSESQLDRFIQRQPSVHHLTQYSYFKNHLSYMAQI